MIITQSQHVQRPLAAQLDSHSSNEHAITSWHLRRASFWTPRGVSRPDTWKFSTSMSEAPNLARTRTFSCMLNSTCLSVINRRVRRNLSRRSERSRCSSSSTAPDEDEDEEESVVGHRAMKRGEFGSKPRLFGSGPRGSRRTLTGVFILICLNNTHITNMHVLMVTLLYRYKVASVAATAVYIPHSV